MGRKVAPIIQVYKKMCPWKKGSGSDFCNKTLEHQIEELRRDIKEYEERVGMTDGKEATIHAKQ